MRRLGAVVVLALAGFAAAIVVFDSPQRRGCPLRADHDSSLQGRFVGPVTSSETAHEVELTRDGEPLSGADVCVNTEMVGMTGMGYTAQARERRPGHYEVGFRFEMSGDYRTNVVARIGAG